MSLAPDADYVMVTVGGDNLIMAKELGGKPWPRWPAGRTMILCAAPTASRWR